MKKPIMITLFLFLSLFIGMSIASNQVEAQGSAYVVTLATEEAKVCWHHDDLHIDGKLYLQEGVWMDTLTPVGNAVITLAGMEVADQGVEFEIKGKDADKWEYKDKDNLFGNIKEFKIDWKGAKFDYDGDDKFHIHTHFVGGTETTLCIHTGDVSGAFMVAINGTTISYDEVKNITTDVTYEPQKDDNSHVHFSLPFELTSEMTIGVSGAIERTINVADYYEEGWGKFKLVSSFDSALFPEGSEALPDELEYGILFGDDTNMASGSVLIGGWTKKDDDHWEVSDPLTVQISASPESILSGELSTLSWSSTEAESATIDQGVGSVAVSGSIAVSPTETTTYTITASGPGGVTTASTTITHVNSVPVANDQSVTTNEDTPLPITLTASDLDNEPLTYQIVTYPTHGTLSGEPPNVTYSPSENYYGSDAFTFKANDGLADSEPATVSLTINPVNDAPIADAGPDQTAIAGDTVSLDGSGSDDLDGDGLTYAWSFVSMPAESGATLSDPSLVNPTFVADASGTYEVQLIVNDSTADSDPDTVTITANPRMVDVPDVTGLAQADAEATITAADLAVGTITTENSDTVPEGHVISQEPVAGTSVEESSVVDLEVSLGPVVTTPTVSLSASPEVIQLGESATLTWDSTHADTGFMEPDVGSVAVSGSTTVSPSHTTTFTITVTGPSGSASAQATVSVTGNPEPQPEGSFGEQYEDLIPPDATVESYDPKRFSLITGLVGDISGSPITDVSVTVLDHPEYGTATTDGDGRFSIPVEGGTTMTVSYQKDGLLSVQRNVHVPWNDTAIAETITMIAEDPVSTTVTFDDNPETVVTHQSTEVTDASGTRACTMVFAGDNHAYVVDAQGNDVHELSTITTRATEYTTPESMPAVLPPTSAYTYCVEMSVDGAQRVRFEKPVVTWVDNFLGFPVGDVVPVGYYDRDRGVWVPEDNGVVVKLLDINTDGIVDALDADGDDQPDDLDDDGSFSGEVTGLDDPARYPPGVSFWRVEATHFTPRDMNWPITAPSDAERPTDDQAEVDRQGTEAESCQSDDISSFVEERSRVFHEDIVIPGTDMTLHYTSSRVSGYHQKIIVPASGETVPASLTSIAVKVEVSGRTFSQTLAPLPNQVAEFVWDGLDYLGRPVKGSTTAHVTVSFIYDYVYLSSGFAEWAGSKAFAQMGGSMYSTGIVARRSVGLSRRANLVINTTTGDIAEGWTLSPHHHLSPIELSTLYKGDGTIITHNAVIIDTVAGNGTYGSSGDGGPATQAQLRGPRGLAIGPDGSMYIGDTGNDRVRRVDPDGIITTFAGGGSNSPDGGGPAIEAQLSAPEALAVGIDGSVFIGTYSVIYQVDLEGNITKVAGGGGGLGDGGPATEASLNSVKGLAVDPDGNLYIADKMNMRIRRVSTDGIITTVAGNGSTSPYGDGGPATQAGINRPDAVAIDSDGNLCFTWGRRIRRVGPDGIITTLTSGLNTIAQGLAIGPDGVIYAADGYVLSRVGSDGTVTTVGGDGTSCYSSDFPCGDGGLAVQASFLAWDCAIDPTGSLYVVDRTDHRIRKVGPTAAFAKAVTIGDIPFAEDNGLGHIMASSGRHKTTIDLDTGVFLREFSYDEDNNLVSVTDRFGNQTTVERDANGIPTSITSPDGITTTLTIDADNHLTHITYPDSSFYEFEYTADGLLTAKMEPEGNRFEHVFDSIGRLTDATDEEGGHWSYVRTAYANGDILTEVLTGEGNLKSYLDHTESTGAYTSTITDPTGAQTLYSRSGDGLNVNKSLPCGMDLDFKYGLDSEYKFERVKEMQESTPSALTRTTLRDKTTRIWIRTTSPI